MASASGATCDSVIYSVPYLPYILMNVFKQYANYCHRNTATIKILFFKVFFMIPALHFNIKIIDCLSKKVPEFIHRNDINKPGVKTRGLAHLHYRIIFYHSLIYSALACLFCHFASLMYASPFLSLLSLLLYLSRILRQRIFQPAARF